MRDDPFARETYICVTARYLSSAGDTVKKSALTVSTFWQCALDSIACRVV